MSDVPTDTVVAALKQARTLLGRENIIGALAHATTTQQCKGVPGFLVFAAVRDAVNGVLPKGVTLSKFADTATVEQAAGVLTDAIMVVKS